MPTFHISRVTMTGALTRDPELTTLPSGLTKCTLRVVSNGRRKDTSSGRYVEKPGYYTVVLFGAQGENAAKYLAKGRQVCLDGHLDWREYETAAGKREAVEIVVDQIQYLDAPKAQTAPAADSAEPGAVEQAFAAAGNAAPGEDDIPF